MSISPIDIISDLQRYIKANGFELSQRALKIFSDTEKFCYEHNISLFYRDFLLSLLINIKSLSEVINKHGGDAELAVLFLSKLLNAEKTKKDRDEYGTRSYYSDQNDDKYIIIKNCFEYLRRENRIEINEWDILKSIIDIHEEEYPVFSNIEWTDQRFHQPFNTLSHIIGVYNKHLWVSLDVIKDAIQKNDKRKYDLAISFAGEDRKLAKEIAERVTCLGHKVFYDEFEKTNLWGKNLYSYLSEVYKNKAMLCLMIVSKHYANKQWTNHERVSAQARAFEESKEYILPLRLDNTEIPGLLPTTGYIDYRDTSLDEVVMLIDSKIDWMNTHDKETI